MEPGCPRVQFAGTDGAQRRSTTARPNGWGGEDEEGSDSTSLGATRTLTRKTLRGTAAQRAIECGNALIEAKGHGGSSVGFHQRQKSARHRPA